MLKTIYVGDAAAGYAILESAHAGCLADWLIGQNYDGLPENYEPALDFALSWLMHCDH